MCVCNSGVCQGGVGVGVSIVKRASQQNACVVGLSVCVRSARQLLTCWICVRSDSLARERERRPTWQCVGNEMGRVGIEVRSSRLAPQQSTSGAARSGIVKNVRWCETEAE